MDIGNSPSDTGTRSNPISGKRTRRKNSKSRQGCLRCKSRRVKCDEVRPECGNCKKISRQCPGFQQELRWSKRHERGVVPPSSDDNSASRIVDLEAIRTVRRIVDTSDESSIPHGRLNTSTASSETVADDWLLSLPTTWQATTSSCDVQANYNSTGNKDTSIEASIGWASQYHSPGISTPISTPKSLQSPAHLPTTLIEYWFRHVCPMWSTFDSEVNWNRRLARGTWTTSKAVFFTMQTMSATCLIDVMPQLNKTLESARAQATSTILEGMEQARDVSQSPRVAADLVFAVFGLGTSSHWAAFSDQKYPWLEFARELLSIWKLELSKLDELLHEYFCQALTYWEMIALTESCSSIPAKLRRKRRQYQDRLRLAMHLPDSNDTSYQDTEMPWVPRPDLFGTRPNSWCGVSKEVIDVFGQVLALCRGACDTNRPRSTLTVLATSNVLCDMALAHEFQRELLGMDFDALILQEEDHGFPVQTRDDSTPISHLLLTAEAYRQASLLQLHLSFSDLEMIEHGKGSAGTPFNGESSQMKGDGQARAEFVLRMTLELVEILRQIPAQSGSKSIHPMLYVSTAAGLRYDTWPETQDISQASGSAKAASSLTRATLSDDRGPFLPAHAMEISAARRFVWTRLSGLQQAFPERTSDSTLRLVKAIWKEYDDSQFGRSCTHWLDVMAETGLGITLW
ncbi:unnamed protein product [Clonostachys solani]|uniref:Zn(2)-C6 fungal-type domain-containing protein n=1 Tax=Clonostachys solani TaxID=160281 RepID=A0A9N9Z8R1_9HYPO|nr:unnamed protein product [Clonostachys solani]